MRVLHTADWHFGKTLEGRSRMEEQAAFTDELTALVKEAQIDLVLIAGDVYDTVNPSSAAEQLFYDTLARLSDGGTRPVVAIAGNHDHPDRLSASGPLAARQGITLLGLPVEAPVKLQIARTREEAVIYALPYPSESRLQEVLSEAADEALLRSAYSERIARLIQTQSANFSKDTVNMIMSHLYVMGGGESDSERPIQVGGAYTVDAAAFGQTVQYVALGHLHRPQMIKGDIPIRYCGSPIAYSFSEAGQAKSVTIMDIQPGAPAKWEEIPLSSGRPLTKWKAPGGLAEVHRWIEEGKDSRSWIDLELHITESLSMDQIHALRKQHAGIVHIRPIYPSAEREEKKVSISLPVDQLFRQFYIKQTGGAEPEPELVQLFMELVREDEERAEEGGEAS
jgi:exonuclease SbcD